MTIDDQLDLPDKCLCLDYKEALRYSLNLEDWTTLDLYFSFSLVDPNTLQPATTFAYNANSYAPEAGFMVGLKLEDTQFPNKNTAFAGVKVSDIIATGGRFYLSSYNNATYFYLGTQVPNQWTAGYSYMFSFGGKYSVSDGAITSKVLGAIRLRYTVSGKGTGTQKIMLQHKEARYTIDASGYATAQAVKLAIGTGLLGFASIPVDMYWAKDGVPLALPTQVFIYWPFPNSRLCIHTVMIEKIN